MVLLYSSYRSSNNKYDIIIPLRLRTNSSSTSLSNVSKLLHELLQVPEIFVGELFLDDPASLLFLKVVAVARVESFEDEL